MIKRPLLMMTLVSLVSLAWTCAASAQFIAEGLCQQAATNAETGECFAKAAKEASGRLNRVYATIEDFLKAQNRTDDARALQEAEQRWTAFRDANCAAAGSLYGTGTGGPVNAEACIEKQTRQRTEDLQVGYGWLLQKFGHTL